MHTPVERGNGVTVEQVREYWNRRPCNVRHGTAEVGSAAWSSQVTARKYRVEPHIPAFADFARWKGERVLEIGCGVGTDTLEFLRAGAGHVDAVDVSEQSIAIAFNRIAGQGYRNVSFHCQDAEASLPAGPFDLIYSFGVLHHTPDPRRVLRHAHAALAPGGTLLLMLYARWSIKFLLGEQPEAQEGCPLARTYTALGVRRLLGGCGFTVTRVQKAHVFPWRVDDYTAHRYVKRWPYRVMPPWLFRALERVAGHHLLITAEKAQ